MNDNFQPAGMLGDQEDSDLEYMDFGDNGKPQKPPVVHSVPQYVPKHTGGFGVPEKKRTNEDSKEHSVGERVSKARQRKKRANALPSDAMTNDNFRVACSRGNLEELRKHLANGMQCVLCIVTMYSWYGEYTIYGCTIDSIFSVPRIGNQHKAL